MILSLLSNFKYSSLGIAQLLKTVYLCTANFIKPLTP